jgi:hypothetical protein
LIGTGSEQIFVSYHVKYWAAFSTTEQNNLQARIRIGRVASGVFGFRVAHGSTSMRSSIYPFFPEARNKAILKERRDQRY